MMSRLAGYGVTPPAHGGQPGGCYRPYAQRSTSAGVDAVGHPLVRYEDADRGFTATLTFDADGFVLDYPGLAHRFGRR